MEFEFYWPTDPLTNVSYWSIFYWPRIHSMIQSWIFVMRTFDERNVLRSRLSTYMSVCLSVSVCMCVCMLECMSKDCPLVRHMSASQSCSWPSLQLKWLDRFYLRMSGSPCDGAFDTLGQVGRAELTPETALNCHDWVPNMMFSLKQDYGKLGNN